MPAMVAPKIEKLADAQSNVFAFEKQHYRNSGVISMPCYGVPAADNPKYPNGGTDANGTGATAVPCRIVRLHAPIEELVVVWNCLKEGEAPVVPNPYLFDKNAVFKWGRVSGGVPIDGIGYAGHGWAFSGVYHYAMIAPTDLNSTMQVGILPWETNLTVDNSILPNVNFLNSLLEKDPPGYTPPSYEAPI
jgi:hypothetical protein